MTNKFKNINSNRVDFKWLTSNSQFIHKIINEKFRELDETKLVTSNKRKKFSRIVSVLIE